MAAAQADSPPAADHAAVARPDFAIFTTIPVGLHPIAVGTSAAGSLAYVANLNSNTLSVIDTDIDAVVSTVKPDRRRGMSKRCRTEDFFSS